MRLGKQLAGGAPELHHLHPQRLSQHRILFLLQLLERSAQQSGLMELSSLAREQCA